MHLKTTFYHILAILETFCTEERKTEAQSTNFWVTPDKMVHPIDVVVVVLLFYVHGKHLRSCRDGQLT